MSACTADRRLAPKARRASPPRQTKVKKSAAKLLRTPLPEEPAVNPAKIKGRVRMARGKLARVGRPKPQQRRTETPVQPRLQQQALAHGRVPEAALSGGVRRAARMKPVTSLQVESVVARDHLRRRR
jgi:hypothetical protein